MSGARETGSTPITAAHVAVALVAACGLTGVNPQQVFEDRAGGGLTRVLAAAACVAALDWPKRDAARVFRIHPNRLTPSGLKLAKVSPQRLTAVAEALAAQGLGRAGSRAPASPSPAAEARLPERKAGSDGAKPGPSRPAASEAPRPAPPAPARRPTPANPVRAPTRPAGVQRLKPVTDRVVRWTRQQLSLGADLAFVADCFDVDRDALAAAVQQPMGMAA